MIPALTGVNMKKLVDETYFTEPELDVLLKRFKAASNGKKLINKEQFRMACCGSPGPSFFADRLYEVFLRQSDSSAVGGHMMLDFVGFAKGLSTFCPTANLEEKMFVCFKVFDLEDDDVISANDLLSALKSFLTEFRITLSPAQLQQIVTETMRDANCKKSITFEKFKILFIRSRGLIDNFTLETWELVDDASEIPSFSGMMSDLLSPFKKSGAENDSIRRTVSVNGLPSAPNIRRHPSADDDMDTSIAGVSGIATGGGVLPPPTPRDPNLRKWYDRTISSSNLHAIGGVGGSGMLGVGAVPMVRSEGTLMTVARNKSRVPGSLPPRDAPSVSPAQIEYALPMELLMPSSLGTSVESSPPPISVSMPKPIPPTASQNTQFAVPPTVTGRGQSHSAGAFSTAKAPSSPKIAVNNDQNLPPMSRFSSKGGLGKQMASDVLSAVMGKVMAGHGTPRKDDETRKEPGA
jgi:Ca2+-binding EF-hand superfamily protein